MTFALRAAGIPAKLSNSPSTYLCNQMMYTVLHLVDRKRMATRAGFIHVPATPSYVAKQAYPFVEMPSMSIELMTLAVLESLAAIAAAQATSRRRPSTIELAIGLRQPPEMTHATVSPSGVGAEVVLLFGAVNLFLDSPNDK